MAIPCPHEDTLDLFMPIYSYSITCTGDTGLRGVVGEAGVPGAKGAKGDQGVHNP